MRVSSHDDINTFSQNANVPIINALSDESHPCQLLADMMTYKELTTKSEFLQASFALSHSLI
jgi:ornithine carbamoyltransferase